MHIICTTVTTAHLGPAGKSPNSLSFDECSAMHTSVNVGYMAAFEFKGASPPVSLKSTLRTSIQ